MDSGGGGHTDGASGPVAAVGISLGRIEANQASAVGIADAGQEIAIDSRNAELIQGRETLVEAEWILDDGFESGMIEAHLELHHSDGTTEELVDEKRVSGPSNLSDRMAAFVWELTPEQVDPDLRYRITLLDPDGGSRGGDSSGSAFPRQGTATFALRAEKMTMKLVLVPVTTPQGSVSLDASRVAMVEERLHAAYPLQEIDVRVREPWVRSAVLTVVDDAFNYLDSARTEDGEGTGSIYHMVLDNDTCCTGADFDGWDGIGNLVDPVLYPGMLPDSITKVYAGDTGDNFVYDIDVMIHEIGHDHGRDHAPCGDPDGPDPNYPYPNAALGARGWDMADDVIIDPVVNAPQESMPYTDFMSYCFPNWWSDYNWQAILERVRIVTAMMSEPPGDVRLRLRGFARPSGEVTWSWIRVAANVPLDRSGGSLVLRGATGEATELPVRVSSLGDTPIRMIEAEVPVDVRPDELAAVELQLDDGLRHTAPAEAIVMAR